MMREIKFRLWDAAQHKMRFPNGDISPGVFWEHGTLLPIQGYLTLLQYTGLKDKDGKEIYEGDILDGHDDGLAAVVWRHGETQFDFADGGNIGVWEMQCSKSQVIGNIYEDPELLENK